MRYETANAFRTALEQRLKNEAQASGIALLRLRKRVAFERFLARLTTSESGGTPALDAATGFHAVRYTVRADLDGRRFEQFPVDVAFSESSPIQAEPLFGASSLEFANVAALQLPVISLEQHVAEKLHAYTGTFGQDERESTRVKDLVDLVLIGELAEMDAKRLHQALATTFAQRDQQPLPNAIPSPPSSWARPYAVLAREVGIADGVEAGHAAVARLLDPDAPIGSWRALGSQGTALALAHIGWISNRRPPGCDRRAISSKCGDTRGLAAIQALPGEKCPVSRVVSNRRSRGILPCEWPPQSRSPAP